jgi:hypothetical protein
VSITTSQSYNRNRPGDGGYTDIETHNLNFSGQGSRFALGCSQQVWFSGQGTTVSKYSGSYTDYTYGDPEREHQVPYDFTLNIPTAIGYGVDYYLGKEVIGGEQKYYVSLIARGPGIGGAGSSGVGSVSASATGNIPEDSFSVNLAVYPNFGPYFPAVQGNSSSTTWYAVFNATDSPPECIYNEWSPDPSGSCGELMQYSYGTGPHCPQQTRVVPGTCANCQPEEDGYGNQTGGFYCAG